MGTSRMNDYFECSCSSKEHTFCVTSEESSDDWPPELFISLQLIQPRNLFNKLITSIKYLFGYKCQFGHWDVINLGEDETNRMIVLLHQHKVRLHKFNSEREKTNENE